MFVELGCIYKEKNPGTWIHIPGLFVANLTNVPEIKKNIARDKISGSF